MNAIFTRTSVRSYENRPVEEEKITKILRAAMAAPSAVNQQPWEFYVVTAPQVLQELSKASPYSGMAAKAPAAVVVCGRKEGLAVPELVEVDLSLATENILLEIETQGLGGGHAGHCAVRRAHGKGSQSHRLAGTSIRLYGCAVRLSRQEKSPARPL